MRKLQIGANNVERVIRMMERGPVVLIGVLLIIPLLPGASAATFDLVAVSGTLEKTPVGVNRFDYAFAIEFCSLPNGQTDNWWGNYVVFNGDAAAESHSYLETADFPSCSVTTSSVQRDVLLFTTYNYCCGFGVIDSAGLIDETNEYDNVANENPGRLAIFAGQSANGKLAVFNWGPDTATFSSSYSGLPAGWTISWITGTAVVDPGEEGVLEYELTAPGSVGQWPTLTFTHSVSGKPGLTQTSVHEIVDDTYYDSICAA